MIEWLHRLVRELTEKPWRSAAADRPRTVLVTGAAGAVASAVRPFLRDAFETLHLTDIRQVDDVRSNERFSRADLRDEKSVAPLMRDADAIIHLAGAVKSANSGSLTAINVCIVDDLLRLAVDHGVRRVALASTMHVLGLYRRDEPIQPFSVPRPDGEYATSKVTMEQLGERYASRGDVRVASIRIGCLKATRDESEPGGWIGPADLAGIFELSITHPDIRHVVVNAVAKHAGDDVGQEWLTKTFGYPFRERGHSYAKALEKLQWWYPNDPVARIYRGGEFASASLSAPHFQRARATHGYGGW